MRIQVSVVNVFGPAFDLSRFQGMTPVALLGGVEFPRIGELPYLLTLAGHGFYWFRLTSPEGPL